MLNTSYFLWHININRYWYYTSIWSMFEGVNKILVQLLAWPVPAVVFIMMNMKWRNLPENMFGYQGNSWIHQGKIREKSGKLKMEIWWDPWSLPNFYPRPIGPEGYCHHPRRLSVCPSVRPSVRLSVCPSVRPTLVTALQPTIFRAGCSYHTWWLIMGWSGALLKLVDLDQILRSPEVK